MAQHPILTALKADVEAGRKVLADLRKIRTKLDVDVSKIDARFSEQVRHGDASQLRAAAYAAANDLLARTDVIDRLRNRAAEGERYDRVRYFASGRFESPAAASPKLAAADGTYLPPILTDSDRLMSARFGQVVESIEALRWQVLVARLTTRALLDRLRDCIAGQLWGVVPIIVAEADYRAGAANATVEDRGAAVEVRREVEGVQVAEFDNIVAAYQDCADLARWIPMVSGSIANGTRSGHSTYDDVTEEKLAAMRQAGASNDEIRRELARANAA